VVKHAIAVAAACAALSGCAGSGAAPPTAADAKAFLETVNATTLKLNIAATQAGWVQQNFITDDTEALAARANQESIDATAKFAKAATKFDATGVVGRTGVIPEQIGGFKILVWR